MKKIMAKALLLLGFSLASATDSQTLYWYNKTTADFFKDVSTHLQPGDSPKFVCLSWMKPCTPGDKSHAVIRNLYLQGTKTKSLSGIPSNGLAEVYHNGWYQEPGLYFYVAKGAGVFLNVGHTLIARNKIDALKKLGLSDKDILKSLPISVFRQVAEGADKQGEKFTEALHDTLSKAQQGHPYEIDRLNDTMSADYLLYETAREKGYDTVQLTNQPNSNGGWAFELVDVRADMNESLKNRWRRQRYFLQSANATPCYYPLPLETLSCNPHMPDIPTK